MGSDMNTMRCSARRRMELVTRRAEVATLSWRRGVGDDWRDSCQLMVHGPVPRTVSKSTRLTASRTVSSHWAFDVQSRLLRMSYNDILWRDGDETYLPPPDNNMFDEEHMLGVCDMSTHWLELYTATSLPHRLANALERRGVHVPRRPWGLV